MTFITRDQMSLTIRAHYSGICAECGQRWQPSELIRSDTHPPEWKHAVCPDDPKLAKAQRGEVSCPHCWLIHPLTADCDR